MNNKISAKSISKLVFMFGFVLGGLTLLSVGAKALYYGSPTSTYKESGYLIVEENNGQYGQCGVNFVSDKAAVTAAHCLDNVRRAWANPGTFRKDFQSGAPRVASMSISPKYSKYEFSTKPGYADVGVILFSESVDLPSYGKIASPKEGCGYYLVGYGKNEMGGSLSRTGTDVCIKNLTDYSFELDFEGRSHFCQGDSGSGIYRKGTDEIVGVVSAYYTSLYSQDCKDGVAFIAARLDYNNDYLSSKLPSNVQKEVAPTPEKTVPDDYFGEYHPETKKEDGTFNYNNEIMIQIDRLGQIFDEIYPEEEFEGTQTPPDDKQGDIKSYKSPDTFGNDQDTDYNSGDTYQDEWPDTFEGDLESEPIDQGWAVIGFVIGLVCCFGFIVVFIVVLFVILSKRNKVS